MGSCVETLISTGGTIWGGDKVLLQVRPNSNNKPPGVRLWQVYLKPDPYLSRCFLAASYTTCSRCHAV